MRVIVSISGGKEKTIVLDKPLEFRHYSEIETHNGKPFPMRAEVILLTRNVKI